MSSEPVDIRPDAAAPADADAGPEPVSGPEQVSGPDLDAADRHRPQTDSPVADRVMALLGPVVATAGVELLDVEWTGGTLRIVLDHEDGVTTDSLATVNRLISPILDQHDPVPGRYTLEVSSPGVERPLRREEHYRRAIGEKVVVKSIPGIDPRRVKGLLTAVDPTGLTIEVVEVDGVDLTESETMRVELADVASARTVFDWGPGPKPGAGASGGKNRSGQAHPKKQKQSQRKSKKKASARKPAGGKPSAEGAPSGENSPTSQSKTVEQERGRP